MLHETIWTLPKVVVFGNYYHLFEQELQSTMKSIVIGFDFVSVQSIDQSHYPFDRFRRSIHRSKLVYTFVAYY